MNVLEWVVVGGFAMVASAITGAMAWHRLSADSREDDLVHERSAGYHEGLKEGLDKGFRQAEAAQHRANSARAHKAARTRAQRRPS